MKIDKIDIYRVSMPLVYPFRTAYGNDDTIESVLVCMRSGGVEGWGEATPWSSPGYSAECAKTAFIIIRDFLAPRLHGEDIQSGNALQERLAWVKGNYFAKAALDLAWWDLEAKLQGRPLYQLLGGGSEPVAVGADFGVMDSIDELLKTMATAVADGFKRVKLKFRPGWDTEMVRCVRANFPDTVIHIDCNSAYTLADSAMFQALDAYNLAMVEQPLAHDDLVDHAALQKKLRTPICLDESITTVARARKAIALNACGWINIKPGRVGGLTPAVQIHDLAREAGVPCWVGGMLESSVGAHHCLALATLPNFTYPNDLFPSRRFYHQDMAAPDMVLCAPSLMRPGDIAGCGAQPISRRLQEQTLEYAGI